MVLGMPVGTGVPTMPPASEHLFQLAATSSIISTYHLHVEFGWLQPIAAEKDKLWDREVTLAAKLAGPPDLHAQLALQLQATCPATTGRAT
jgi:hypothetical protein